MKDENLNEKRQDPVTGEKQENPITGETGPGTGLRDLLPLPAENAQDIFQSKKAFDKSAGGIEDGHTIGHELATEDHRLKGAAQLESEKEVRNLGWNEPKQEIAAPLVGGIDNEELWMLVRRFNKASNPLLSGVRTKSNTLIANHPHQDRLHSRARWPGPQHGGRGRVLSRQDAR